MPLCLCRFATPGPQNREQWGWLCLAGTLNALGYALVYMGEESVSGGLAAVVFCIEPLALALLVTVTRTERVRRSDLIGGGIAIVGVALIFLDRLSVSNDQAIGVVLLLLAMLVSGAYNLIVKRHAGTIHPIRSTSIFIVVTAITLWITTLASGWQPIPWPLPAAPSIALLYLGIVGSVLAFAVFFYLLKRVSLMTSSTLVFVLPVIALAVDAVWEDEVQLAGRAYIGIAITLLGVCTSLALRFGLTTSVAAAKPSNSRAVSP